MDDHGRVLGHTDIANAQQDATTVEVDYRYDAMHRQTKVSGTVAVLYKNPDPKDLKTNGNANPIEQHVVGYDWMGNRTSDNTEIMMTIKPRAMRCMDLPKFARPKRKSP